MWKKNIQFIYVSKTYHFVDTKMKVKTESGTKRLTELDEKILEIIHMEQGAPQFVVRDQLDIDNQQSSYRYHKLQDLNLVNLSEKRYDSRGDPSVVATLSEKGEELIQELESDDKKEELEQLKEEVKELRGRIEQNKKSNLKLARIILNNNTLNDIDSIDPD